MEEKVRFGPSGNDVLFWEHGYKSSVSSPGWVKAFGLDAFEYNFGRGIRLSEKMAVQIGEEAKKHGVLISAHAPYFINLASREAGAIEKSYGYIEKSLRLLRLMGGRDLVVHIGSQGELSREEAISNCKKNLKWVIERLDREGYADFDFKICIETMGRYRAIGNYKEICDICAVDRRVIPTLDFGHINCLMQGGLSKDASAFADIIDYCIHTIGKEKMQSVHIHFSDIKFGEKGELAHLTFGASDKFAIPFEPLARVIKRLALSPTVICESSEIMAQDALRLKRIFDDIKKE